MATELWSKSGEPLDPRDPPPAGEADMIRRHRLLAAMAKRVGDHGYAGTRVSALTSEARLSATTFYRLYPSKRACFLAAYDDAVEHVLALVVSAWATHPNGPRERFEAAVAAFLGFCGTHPHVARMCLLEAPLAGRGAYEHRLSALQRAAQVSAHALPPGHWSAERHAFPLAVVGGIVHLVTERLRAGETDSLESLAPQITATVFPTSEHAA
jgi:AcrR family transcriptional regulator